MEMKKIACVALVSFASVATGFAADGPAPAPASGAFTVAPPIVAVLGASILSFFAF
ncbi:hypothetical protein IHE45_05G233500 [Dioscorea alata]|uniref:Uncharacterized protein n=1 Tax=Dioscorea alata TaxID=55571 RepID=A0ACB7W9Q1_DIOAL|nr:hypothetical protein IHE45_05G233500 [Dioscorea alata]